MKLIKFLLLIPAFAIACSPVFSRKTDDQAWLEFKNSLHSERVPASVGHANSKTIRFREALEEIQLRSLLLSCMANESLKPCYENALSRKFDEVFRKLEPELGLQAATDYKQEQKRFFEEHSFDQTFAEVQAFHQRLLSGIDLRAAEHSRELSQECQKWADRDRDVRDFKSFRGGTTELPKGVFACLNEQWTRDTQLLLNETTDRLNLVIATSEASEWIKKYQIDPIYTQETHHFFNQLQEEQLARWKKNQELVRSELKFDLPLSEFVKENAQKYRKDYPFLTLEVLLTELYDQHSEKRKYQ